MNLLDDLVAEIRASAKYRFVAPDFIRTLGAKELSHQSSYKLAVKATRNKLHQVGGAYFDHPNRYLEWFDELQSACATDGIEAIKPICRRLMANHASTRERLPILEDMYATIFSHLPDINSICDYACGLNPLALPWMNLSAGATYTAVDIYEDLMSFVRRVISLCGYTPDVQAGSILSDLDIKHKVDLALLLKVLPCLEQLEKNAGASLLESIDADYVVASFPVHSLRGYSKGMVSSYDQAFHRLLEGKDWPYERFLFATELVFLINKSA